MKRLSLIFALMACCLGLAAQEKSSSGFGLDPSDGPAVEWMRARSDSIRQHRPVVALVLSGGGAKGAAMIGALKYMEQYQLPIDMVLGTSVGGLLGGFYALGYSPDFLTELIRSIDWMSALTDNVEPRFLPRSRIAYKERFALSFPFYYRPEEEEFELLDFADFTDGKLNLSATAVEDATRLVTDNLKKSLPSGAAYGQNVNQIISSRTVGYSDSTDFFSFPIPFACVSTDIVSGKAKVWHNGNINTALRATMSIPGIYVPARSGNMVLLDGGMRNNFPADIAKDLGADIVIGIDLCTDDPDMNADKIRNIKDVVMGALNMFDGDSYERSKKAIDLRIKPDLTGYNLMSFSSTAVEFMLVRGYRAAEEMAPQLDSIRAVIGPEKLELTRRNAVDIGKKSVLIDSIEIAGLREKDATYLRSKLYIKEGSFVNSRILGDEVSRIFGGGSFDYVNYELLGTEEPYKLRLNAQKGPVHQFGVGLRLDSEEIVTAILNLGLNTNSPRGSSLDITTRISPNPWMDMVYKFVPSKGPTFNIRNYIRFTDRNSVLFGENYFNVSFWDIKQELYLSDINYAGFSVSTGLSNDFNRLRRFSGTTLVGNYSKATDVHNYLGAFLAARKNTLDSSYFPETGVSAGLRGEFFANPFGQAALQTFGVVSADAVLPLSFWRFSLVPQAYLRFVIGDDIPLYYANIMGGDIAGRYADQQIPFMGINNALFRRNYLGMGRLDLRYRAASNHYITLTGNASWDFLSFDKIRSGELIWGVGAGYAYNTIVGPLKLNLHYSSLTGGLGAYFAVGFSF